MEQTDRKIQEMQIVEQNLHNLLLQKQAFQLELNETKAALKELDNADEEVYKIIGQLMIKSDVNKIKEELTNKEKILDLRTKSIEKQEASLAKQLEDLRKELMKPAKK